MWSLLTAISNSVRRHWPLYLGGLLVALLAWSAFDARGGTPEPTAGEHLSHGAVVFDSALLVFREGLETILVLAAVTASMVGAAQVYRRPIALGAVAGFLASVATWFLAAWVLGQLGAGGLAVQAATGLLAVIVLLVVMNWFFHKVYWTGWIQNRNKHKKKILSRSGVDGRRATMWGLILLGITSVYREGFEVVLFLQNLRLTYGAGTVLEGVALGLSLTAVVGVITFLAHKHMPYKRMLILTGVMLGVVLIVMVGESVQEMQLAGWLPETTVPLSIPGWIGLWFAVFPTVEGLVAQVLAAALVLGSYFGAEYWRIKRPRKRAAVATAGTGAPHEEEAPAPAPVLDPDAPRIAGEPLGARPQPSISAETTAS
ncbi:MAG: FTR1 family protein [Actinobacteria bacterium]|nr:FTR1 family protein [Actinomycetota bacterium]